MAAVVAAAGVHALQVPAPQVSSRSLTLASRLAAFAGAECGLPVCARFCIECSISSSTWGVTAKSVTALLIVLTLTVLLGQACLGCQQLRTGTDLPLQTAVVQRRALIVQMFAELTAKSMQLHSDICSCALGAA